MTPLKATEWEAKHTAVYIEDLAVQQHLRRPFLTRLCRFTAFETKLIEPELLKTGPQESCFFENAVRMFFCLFVCLFVWFLFCFYSSYYYFCCCCCCFFCLVLSCCSKSPKLPISIQNVVYYFFPSPLSRFFFSLLLLLEP